jgi:two-component system response regulator RegA
MSAPRRLLIVEDNPGFAATLRRSFERRGYAVWTAGDFEQMEKVLQDASPQYAVVDLKLERGSGLVCVRHLHAFDPAMRVVVLTGFASINTAVEAIKLGACHYLAKPSNTDDIESAFARADGGDASIRVSQRPTSIKTLEWERINETLIETNFNISEAARRLGLHRRTLARKLAKRPIS